MTTKGLAEWDRKVRAIPAKVKEAAKAVNNDIALDFMQQVAVRVPKSGDREGDRAGEHLVGTLQKTDGAGGSHNSGMGVTVSIGGPEAPYPMHLEGGHMTKGGKHVPAKPFWFPVLRVNRKRWKARRAAAIRKAIKALIGSGGGGG